MAVGQETSPSRFLASEIFRCFWIALDPRKLLIAAVGILATSLGWWLFSYVWFHFNKDAPDAKQYEDITFVRAKLGKIKMITNEDGQNVPKEYEYSEDICKVEGKRLFAQAAEKYQSIANLAGPGGKIRNLPWDEYRGENPYLLLKNLLGGTSDQRSRSVSNFVSTQWLVLLEPLKKIIYPIIAILDPKVTFGTKIYCFICFVWGIAVWAFAGGVITRIAAVQFSCKDRISLMEAVNFVAKRYVSYVSSPMLPIAGIFAITLALMIYGLLGLIPFVGDVILYGLLFPVVLVAGLLMAVLLIGLVGYPLMYPTISVEGSDTFDALSRSYSYVISAPGRFLWYCFVAIVFGVAVTYLVYFAGSMAVYLGKWALNQTASAIYSKHTPDYLFVNAPRTLGWREILTQGSPIEMNPNREEVPQFVENNESKYVDYAYIDGSKAEEYLNSYRFYHKIAAFFVSLWLGLTVLVLVGFSYSYFWSAATMVYLLMRKNVDDTELDEVYLETNDTPMTPVNPTTTVTPSLAGSTTSTATSSASSAGTSLPMVPMIPPTGPVQAAAKAASSAENATVPFPTTTNASGSSTVIKPDDQKK